MIDTELIAREEAKRERHVTLEQRQAWEQSFLRLLSETPEHQAYCTPQATMARQAELLKLHEAYRNRKK